MFESYVPVPFEVESKSIPYLLAWNDIPYMDSKVVNEIFRFYPLKPTSSKYSSHDISCEELSLLSTDIVWTVDASTGIICAANSALDALLGIKLLDIVGMRFVDTVAFEDRGTVKKLLSNEFNESSDCVAAILLRRQHCNSGKYIMFESRWRRQVCHDGSTASFIIVERRLKDNAQFRNDESNNDGFQVFHPKELLEENASDFAIYCIDCNDGTILSVNTECSNMLGYQPVEMLHRSYYDFIESEHLSEVIEAISAVTTFKNAVTVEFSRQSKNGQILNVECSISLNVSNDNESSCVVCVEHKISHPISKICDLDKFLNEEFSLTAPSDENRSQEGSSKFEYWESNLMQLASCNSDYIYVIQVEPSIETLNPNAGIITEVNSKAAEVLGLARDTIIGKSDVFSIAGHDVVRVTSERQSVFSTMHETCGNNETTKYRHTYQRNCTDGRIITVESSYFGVFESSLGLNRTPILKSIIVMERDLTKQTSQDEEILKLRTALSRVTLESINGQVHCINEESDSKEKQNTTKKKKRRNKSKNKRNDVGVQLEDESSPPQLKAGQLNPRLRNFFIQYLGLSSDDVNAPTDCVIPELRYPLVVAAAQKNAFKLSLLISLGADCNILPREIGFGALHMAVMSNSIECLSLLVANGADLEIRAEIDEETATPLAIACKEDYAEIVNALLSLGANPNCQDQDGNTPLHYAVELDNIHIARALLSNGASLLLANNEGYTPASLVERSTKLTNCGVFILEESRKLNDINVAELLTMTCSEN